MSKVLISSIGVSADGFAAGPNQDLENPLGIRGPELMEWFFHTRVFRSMHGGEGGETGVALKRAKEAAGSRDVRIGGGVSTIEAHVALRPVVLGTGENLWNGLDLCALGYNVAESMAGERALHVILRRS